MSFDHLTIGVADLARSIAFYDRALAPLDLVRLVNSSGPPGVAAYGERRPIFWLVEQELTRGKLHIAFTARDQASVDAFHRASLPAGGIDHGTPGLRPEYHAEYYGAFVLDPDGHNIEAVAGNGQ